MKSFRFSAFFLILFGLPVMALAADSAPEYPWARAMAKVLPTGDLKWAPEPYEYEAGDVVRYIDYEDGDDTHPGTSKNAAWKHHPWDPYATGNAASHEGVTTYVFKGGVAYRGQLNADESGQQGDPIRLVSDPSWGEGKPFFYGSSRLPAKWMPATEVDVPERLPEVEKIWAIDLKALGFADERGRIIYSGFGDDQVAGTGEPRTVFRDATYTGLYIVNGEDKRETLHLARTPDWQPPSPNFAMDYWHEVDAPFEIKKDGKMVTRGFQDEIWKNTDLPEDYFTDGFIWIQYRSFMGTPTPSKISTEVTGRDGESYSFFNPEEGVLLKHVYGGHGDGGLRYMIENLPQFLDSAGEFYLQEGTGILFFRPEEGVDPNTLHLELTDKVGQIRIANQSHIQIGGLGFSFAHGNTIHMEDSVKDIRIHNCVFKDVPDIGVEAHMTLADEKRIADGLEVADCSFENIGTSGVDISGERVWNDIAERGELHEVNLLRNRTHYTGMRHRSSRWSNVSALSVVRLRLGQIAGNIVENSFGSGIVVLGGKEGALGPHAARDAEIPHIRILVHHNKTENTALGVNDYGGLAIWQGGGIYTYNNIIGNSPGLMPAGFFGNTNSLSLSYPYYLDGAYKVYSFNNIIWGRSVDPEDRFANTTSGYFQVFGFLNQFTNNVIYRIKKAVGGSSGNRCDIVSNVFAEIPGEFFANNREGDPSLVGGGDDASSGMRGVPSLGFARNILYGKGEAGTILNAKRRGREAFDKEISAASVTEMKEEMAAFPIRVPLLGEQVPTKPLIGAPEGPITAMDESVSFQPVEGSPVIDAGGTYFVPWSLKATVGEWNFNKNFARPRNVTDYHWFMDAMHFHRSMYEYVPSFDLTLNQVELSDYVASVSEDWIPGALVFDGKRFGSYPDAEMRKDFKLPITGHNKIAELVSGKQKVSSPWLIDEPSGPNGKYTEDDFFTYPAELRNTLIVEDENLLIEAIFATDPGAGGVLLNKHDGQSGYALRINSEGQAEFIISSSGETVRLATDTAVNDGGWKHVIGEIDRATGRMTIYLNGEPVGQAEASIPPDASIDNQADVIVGKAFNDSDWFRGKIDFLRVALSTLEESRTDIAELFAWQTNGPFRRDYLGNEPVGRRDAGAIEKVQ